MNEYGFLSIIPIILVLFTAFWKKNVFLALAAGLAVSSVIVGAVTGNFLSGISAMANVFTSSGTAATTFFVLIMGGIMTSASKSGGVEGLVRYATERKRIITTRRRAELFHKELFDAADRGIYPGRFTKEDIAFFRTKCKQGESFMFRGAPHALFVHAPIGRGEWVYDTQIALTYVELLMESYDIGTIYVSTPGAALSICPKSRAFLGIPENHYITVPMGFGYPEYTFKRGVSRSDALKIHHL